MDWYRIRHTIGMYLCPTAIKRAKYLKKHNILYHVGDNCMVMFRKIPLYPKLISIGNNVWIASDVLLIPHDVIHRMLNNKFETNAFLENIGCIDIKDNVFIGSKSTILPNVTIGSNTIVGAGTLVNKNIQDGVYAGVPAKYICSLEEFAEKRMNEYPKVEIIRRKGGLSEKTIADCWKRFNDIENSNEKLNINF